MEELRRDLPGHVSVTHVEGLWFGPKDPVRAASAVARLGDGWLIAQDDAVHGAWWRSPYDGIERVRLLDPRQGLEVFGDAAGTKRLKPDLEAACEVPIDGGSRVLLLGSGSLPNRTCGVLVDLVDGHLRVRSRDLTPLYHRVASALDLDEGQLNLEGACAVGGQLRWFQRGHGRSEVSSASVDLDLAAVLGCLEGRIPPTAVDVGEVYRYDLGSLHGIPLAITDAVVLPDGRVCVAATAEDTPDAVADGRVAGSVLALVDRDGVDEVLPLPSAVARHKVEGLALAGVDETSIQLLAVVDADDPEVGSTALHLALRREGQSRSSGRVTS